MISLLFETFMFSYFINQYFHIDNKNFFLISSFISNYIVSLLFLFLHLPHNLNIIIYTIIMLCYIQMIYHSVTIDHALTCIIFLLFMFFIQATIQFIMIPLLLNDSIKIILTILLSNFIIYQTIKWIINNNYYIHVDFNFRKWWFACVNMFINLIVTFIIIYSLYIDNLNKSLLYVLLIMIIISNFTFLFVLYKTNQIYKDNVKQTKLIQKNNFNKYNYMMIWKTKKEIEDLEHQLSYILLQIKEKSKDNHEISQIVDNYFQKNNHFAFSIATGNHIFDYYISIQFHSFLSQKRNLKYIINISESPFYNDIETIIFFSTLFKNLDFLQKLFIEIYEINQYCIIKIHSIKLIEINDSFLSFLDNNNFINKYKLNQDTQCLSILINMKQSNKKETDF